ncbi:hypothetical protein ACTFIR_010875 [Dictyostelium discoideum]
MISINDIDSDNLINNNNSNNTINNNINNNTTNNNISNIDNNNNININNNNKLKNDSEDSNIYNILNRIEINISIASNDVIKPLLTPDGNNKIQPTQSNPNDYSTIQFPKSNVYIKLNQPQNNLMSLKYYDVANNTNSPIEEKNEQTESFHNAQLDEYTKNKLFAFIMFIILIIILIPLIELIVYISQTSQQQQQQQQHQQQQPQFELQSKQK